MSNRLKFRAWNGKKMVECGVIPMCVSNDVKCIFDGYDRFYTRDHPVMQFTGIKDINGFECFEGDIVEIYSQHPSGDVGMTGEVKFLDGQYVVDNGFGAEYLYRDDCAFIIDGNIHQNPELLEK